MAFLLFFLDSPCLSVLNSRAISKNYRRLPCFMHGTAKRAPFSTNGLTWDPEDANSSTTPGPGSSARRSSRSCPVRSWPPRSPRMMRRILPRKDLDAALFPHVPDKLATIFSVDTRTQRLDSVHIFSNMAHLGRIRIFVRVITRFLVDLKRHHRDLFESLDGFFSERYLPRKGQGVFSMVKPSETDRTLQRLATDLFDLVRCFADDKNVSGMSSYQSMSRVLSEQCSVVSNEDGGAVSGRPPAEGRSDSLQTPSGPETHCAET